jgi:hypothetical protein
MSNAQPHSPQKPRRSRGICAAMTGIVMLPTLCQFLGEQYAASRRAIAPIRSRNRGPVTVTLEFSTALEVSTHWVSRADYGPSMINLRLQISVLRQRLTGEVVVYGEAAGAGAIAGSPFAAQPTPLSANPAPTTQPAPRGHRATMAPQLQPPHHQGTGAPHPTDAKYHPHRSGARCA